MAGTRTRSALEVHPRPSVTVDVVALTLAGGALRVAVSRRAERRGRGRFALPGDVLGIGESLDDAAARVLAHALGLAGVFIEQLHTFGEVRRDPRGRVVTVAYYALVDARRFAGGRGAATTRARVLVPSPRARRGRVAVVDDGGRALPMFLDQGDMVALAVERLRGKLDDSPIAMHLLPAELTLRQLQEVHEAVRGEPVNKDSFRRRLVASGWLEATGAHEREVLHRPAELYRFRRH